MGVRSMYRVIAVVACGVALTACSSSWLPSFELPSFGSSGGGGSGIMSLSVESDPPGAQASAGAASCVTPCRLNVAVNGPFNVNIALNGYVPQSVPIRIMQPDDPRLASDDGGLSVRLDPNPVYVELERAPAPPPPPQKKKPTPKHPPTAARQTGPTTAEAPAISAPTTAVAPSTAPAPAPAQPTSSAAPWPMPR
jgi:hypothetical protein